MHTPTKNIAGGKYGWATRLAHMGLALAVIVQLATSQFMHAPHAGRPGNAVFEYHEYGGLVALVFAFLFWLVVMMRRTGTTFGELVPWLTAAGWRRVWADFLVHFDALRRFRLPAYHEHAPFVSAIHGLGLLLMTFMAASGGIYYFASLYGDEHNEAVHLLMEVHGAFGNLVWAYLIGHASLAVLHHLMGEFRLSGMWSLGRG